MRDHDFCLVALENHPLREHYTDLSFMRYWDEIQAMIWEGQSERAEHLGLPALGRAIVELPDLLPDEQTRVLELCRANFEAEVKRWQSFVTGSKPSARRGAPGATSRTARISGKAGLHRAAAIARQAHRAADVTSSLEAVAEAYEAVPQLADGATIPPRADGSQRIDLRSVFDQQMVELRKQISSPAPPPAKLFDVFLTELVARPR